MENNLEVPVGFKSWLQLYMSIKNSGTPVLDGFKVIVNNPEKNSETGVTELKRYQYHTRFLKSEVLDEVYKNLPSQIELFAIQEGLSRLPNSNDQYIIDLSKKIEAITKKTKSE